MRTHIWFLRRRRPESSFTRHSSLFVSPSATMLLLLFFLGAIGAVSPFAGGSTADVGGTTSNPLHRHDHHHHHRRRRRQNVPHQLYPPHHTDASRPSLHKPKLQTTIPNPSVQSSLFRRSTTTTTTPLSAVAVESTADNSPTKKSSLLRRIVWNLNPLPGRKDGRWKGGESKATIASRLLFSYVSPLLDVAANRTLTEQDAFEVAPQRKMEVAVEGLADTYDRARRKALYKIEAKRQRLRTNGHKTADSIKNSQTWILLQALFHYQRSTLIWTGCLRLLNTGIQAFPAIIVARLLRSIEAGTAEPVSKSIHAALWLVAVLSTKMIVENQMFHLVVSMSTQVRGALEGLIFDKSLRLPEGGSGVMAKQNLSDEKKALGSGGVLNLMQTDASIIESGAMQVHTLWDGPLQIAMYIFLLFQYLGPSVWYGVAVLSTVIPISAVILRILDHFAQYEDVAKRARTKRTNESISNMKLLKVQSWEDEFAADIDKHRQDELRRHRTRGIVRAINSAVTNAVPSLVLVVTLTAYAKTGKPILASTIFTAISLFNQLRFPLFFYPNVIDSIATGKNALRRISSYLTSEELTTYVNYKAPVDGGKIEMKHGSFLWGTSQEPVNGEVAPPESPALCDVNLNVEPGEVVAVVGPTGSGKSALIKGLLGELAPVPKMLVVNSSGITNSSQTEELMLRPEVAMHGNVGYCSQDAWLPKGTLRDAVVFGREFDENRYVQSLYDAGLDLDMASGMLNSDMDVGEKGSNLSGGQRARVALARALYSGDDTKVFLLDDCLAALDARVGSIVFERVVKRLKGSKAATILVTNDPSLPRQCDRVILMGSTGLKSPTRSDSTCCTIIDTGTYDQLISRGHQLQSMETVKEERRFVPTNDFQTVHEEERSEVDQISTVRVVGGYKVMTNDTDCSCHADPEFHNVDQQNNPDLIAERVTKTELDVERAEEFIAFDGTSGATNDTSTREPMGPSVRVGGLVSTDEKMTTEAVPLSTYVGYLRAVGSPVLIICMLASFAIADGARFFQQFTVAKWTEMAGTASMSSTLGAAYLNRLVYAAGVVSAFLWLRSYLIMIVAQRASSFYHRKMLSSVFRAPMSFFDATPSGQILSRFGRELETIDKYLPDAIGSVIFCALQIMSSVLALSGAITPAMILPLAAAGSFYVKIMRRFRPAARDMKRTEQRTRSPIVTHFTEALRGTEVIRSIPGARKTWSTRHRTLADTNLAVFSTVKALDRWLSISLEAIGNSVVFATSIASIILTREGRLQAGSAGWGLTQSMAITGLMAWAVRNLTQLESNMMSVIRVKELTDIDAEEAEKKNNKGEISVIPKERRSAGSALEATFQDQVPMSKAPVTDRALLLDGWPWKGGVVFKNVSMRYNEVSPLVLNDVSLMVPPGSTLGVVGRTGSGKSSLLLTLFRIVEIEGGGSIEIDGVDIRSVSIETLRESLAIIPQDPVLFEGTVATNLDATGKVSDEEMWIALEAASPELARQFRSNGGLESRITEGGRNLSQGQRQLMCLARALIRKSKVLVMDEATSSVDAQTDRQVQDTIRKQFVEKGVSVITVAHRLDTVLGYDKIAVLGDGKLLEYGTPSELLKVPSGQLRRLVEADQANRRRGSKTNAEAIPV
ncbi:multidrug ABC transporter permease/ATPase [Nitzschia inconspicua]|uniref:Multidrug ABC transporter permease/ATPase n=1 Tax=Nitzschia inconspicua TaxID=303405 RepID=A0A9K3KUU2_9STRA|nr:multidrug ABC transporter permease/ATPase [Nitzschia inconspicua]